MIDIITYCDNHQKILKDKFFKPTFNLHLRESFNHIDVIYNTDLDSIDKFGFGSDIFQEMIFNRWYMLIDHIKQDCDNKKFSIFSDVDVVFFGNFYSDIKTTCASKRDIDIYFMAENHRAIRSYKNNYDINAGFFIFRHCQNTLSFMENIIEFMTKQKLKEDQIYIRQLLKEKYHSNISLLDSGIFSANNGPIQKVIASRDQKKLKVFHATSCLNIYSKMVILDHITEPSRKQILEKIYDPR